MDIHCTVTCFLVQISTGSIDTRNLTRRYFTRKKPQLHPQTTYAVSCCFRPMTALAALFKNIIFPHASSVEAGFCFMREEEGTKTTRLCTGFAGCIDRALSHIARKDFCVVPQMHPTRQHSPERQHFELPLLPASTSSWCLFSFKATLWYSFGFSCQGLDAYGQIAGKIRVESSCMSSH